MGCSRALTLITFIGLSTFSSQVFSAAKSCDEWFEANKIRPSDLDCDIKCATIGPAHFGNFDCGLECDRLCATKVNSKNISKCSVPAKWKPKVKDVSTKLRQFTLIPFVAEERKQLEKVLSKISEKLPVSDIEGFYRAKTPKLLLSASNPATYDGGKIILYPLAFNADENLAQIVVHELSHHLHETDLKSKFEEYKKLLGWKGATFRDGPFLSNDSKDSPEEDFATNFEFYVFERQKFKTAIPAAHDWMKRNFGDLYQMKECE